MFHSNTRTHQEEEEELFQRHSPSWLESNSGKAAGLAVYRWKYVSGSVLTLTAEKQLNEWRLMFVTTAAQGLCRHFSLDFPSDEKIFETRLEEQQRRCFGRHPVGLSVTRSDHIWVRGWNTKLSFNTTYAGYQSALTDVMGASHKHRYLLIRVQSHPG